MRLSLETRKKISEARNKNMLARAKCKTCSSEFDYYRTNSAGIYCSKTCYYSDKEVLKTQSKNARAVQLMNGISAPKVSDEKLLQLWDIFKNSNASMKSVFAHYGYKRVPPKRLLKILPEGEYDLYKRKNRWKNHGYLSKRGTYYERLAKKQLETDGYLVVRSGGSHGIFDLWALGNGQLKLIQIKATKGDPHFTKLTTELQGLQYPPFCSKELWIWRDRKGWFKNVL